MWRLRGFRIIRNLRRLNPSRHSPRLFPPEGRRNIPLLLVGPPCLRLRPLQGRIPPRS